MTPVNTGLSTISKRPALSLPRDEELMLPDAEEASIRAQIEESARQLSVYFTNLELDGPPEVPADPVVEETPPTSPTSVRSGVSPRPLTQTPERAASSAADDGLARAVGDGTDEGGVRVSLRALAGDQAVGGDEASPGLSGAAGASEPGGSGGDDDGSEAGGAPDDGVSGGGEPLDPMARRDALARELASILGDLVELGDHPGRSALALASLETLLPEDSTTLVDQGVLSEPELATINAVRDLLGSMTSEGELVSPSELLARLEEIRGQLDAWAGLSIKAVALCTRVDGYGRYQPFPSYRFVAGRDQQMIVYTELEHFAQRETTGPEGQRLYEIELSQRLELYHVADDLNAWNRSAETVRDVSRNRVRDYYLTNLVKLPGSLGVGRYHLKVVMRDLIGDKVAETIIPIEIVAQ